MLNTGSSYNHGSGKLIYGDGGSGLSAAAVDAKIAAALSRLNLGSAVMPNYQIALPPQYSEVDWSLTQNTGAALAVVNKPNYATVATTGSYTDLLNQPAAASSSGLLVPGFSWLDASTIGTARPFQVVDSLANLPLANPQTYIIQSFYLNPKPIDVTLPANYFSITIPNGLKCYGYTFNSNASQFITDVASTSGYTFGTGDQTQSGSQPWVGFSTNWTGTALLPFNLDKSGSTSNPIGGVSPITNSTPVVMKPGFNEFRLVIASINPTQYSVTLSPTSSFYATPFQSYRQVFKAPADPGPLSVVASTGNYADLLNKPIFFNSPTYWAHYFTKGSLSTNQGEAMVLPRSYWNTLTDANFKYGNNTGLQPLSQNDFDVNGNFVIPATGIWKLSWTLAFQNYNDTEVNSVYLLVIDSTDPTNKRGAAKERMGVSEIAGGSWITAAHTDYYTAGTKVAPCFLSLVFPNSVAGNAATDIRCGALKVCLVNFAA